MTEATENSPFSRGASVMSGVSETEERVARALCRYTWDREFQGKNLDAYVEVHWRDHCAGARAAIAAMPQGEPVALPSALVGKIVAAMAAQVQHAPGFARQECQADFDAVKRWADHRATPSLPVSEPGVREALETCREYLTGNRRRISGIGVGSIDDGYSGNGERAKVVRAIDAALTPPSPEAQP